MTLFQFSKSTFKPPKSYIPLLIFCFFNGSLNAGEIQYFSQQELNFWKVPEREESTNHFSKTQDAKDKHVVKNDSNSREQPGFQWKKYMDPKNDEFFREGDYLPPAPFLEIVRNPTDENIANWFKYLKTKRELMLRLEKKLAYYSKNLEEAPSQLPPDKKWDIEPNSGNFRLRLYFNSKCPHCEKMFVTIQELKNRGFWIELKQLDGNLEARKNIPFVVNSATPEELNLYKIDSVPTLLIGNLKEKTYSKLQGYQPLEAVLKSLNTSKDQTNKEDRL